MAVTHFVKNDGKVLCGQVSKSGKTVLLTSVCKEDVTCKKCLKMLDKLSKEPVVDVTPDVTPEVVPEPVVEVTPEVMVEGLEDEEDDDYEEEEDEEGDLLDELEGLE